MFFRKLNFFILFLGLVTFNFLSASEENKHSVVILGGGVSGLTCGIYLARAGYTPIIIEGKEPSQITGAHLVENWPGEKKISGMDLIEKIKNQAMANGCKILSKEVIDVDFSRQVKELTVRDIYNKNKTDKITADCVIVAMGCSAKRLNVEGEDKYFGKGVSVCALCDGAFYKNKIVSVVGGSDAALTEALYLSNLAKKVYVIMRGEDFRKSCDQKNKKLLSEKKNVQLITNSVIESISGKTGNVDSVAIKNRADNKIFEIETDALFLAVGFDPNTTIFQGKLDLDAGGYIVTQKNGETSKKGVYAIGDISGAMPKQAITASASGASVAIQAGAYLDGSFSPSVIVQGKAENLTGSITKIYSLDQLDKELKNSSVPILLDFNAKWCGACRRIAPYLHQKAKDLAGVVKIFEVDVDRAPGIASKYGIRAMPTMVHLSTTGDVIEKQKGGGAIVNMINNLEKEIAEN